MLKRPITLLDCDDVLGDFHGHTLGFINSKLGTSYVREDVDQWDIFEALDCKDLEPALDAEINLDEFCLNIPALPGVRDALKELRSMSTVLCLTAPHRAERWMSHRARWLEEQLGFDKHHRVFAHAKWGYYGDVFVDDNGPNVTKWKDFWLSKGLENDGVIYDRVYNRHHADDNLIRVATWDEIIALVEKKARR